MITFTPRDIDKLKKSFSNQFEKKHERTNEGLGKQVARELKDEIIRRNLVKTRELLNSVDFDVKGARIKITSAEQGRFVKINRRNTLKNHFRDKTNRRIVQKYKKTLSRNLK